MALLRAYKILYNLAQTLGWGFIFTSVVSFVLAGRRLEEVWAHVGTVMLACLSVAFLEVRGMTHHPYS
jgi:hypothetical protein